MTYFPPYEPVPIPQVQPFTPSIVSDSPMFQPYASGSPGVPSYIQPSSAQPLIEQINASANARPMGFRPTGVGATYGPPLPEARPFLQKLRGTGVSQGARGIGRGALGGFLSPKTGGLPSLAANILGGQIQSSTTPGSQSHSIGKGLSTGGTLGGLGGAAAGGAAAAGLISGAAVAPITLGLLGGGAVGGYISDRLYGQDDEPATTVFNDENVDHLIRVAMDEHQAGNISQQDFVTIVKQAQLENKFAGDDPEAKAQIAANLQANIIEAANMQAQRQAMAQEEQVNSRRALAEQIAIAKLMQPQLDEMNQQAQSFADIVGSDRGSMSGGAGTLADIISGSAVGNSKKYTTALSASLLALPQIQSLMDSIERENALRQEANEIARAQQSSSGSQSLNDILQSVGVAGPSPAGG